MTRTFRLITPCAERADTADRGIEIIRGKGRTAAIDDRRDERLDREHFRVRVAQQAGESAGIRDDRESLIEPLQVDHAVGHHDFIGQGNAGKAMGVADFHAASESI